MRITTIELAKEAMKFSAGHFTIFNATERERLHGHNFVVSCSLSGAVDENGMLFDYGRYKAILIALCQEWNEYFILPERSPYLRLERKDRTILAHFAKETLVFTEKDVLVLPIANATIEELSALFLENFRSKISNEKDNKLTEITLRVASGPGQHASAIWRKS